MTTKHSHEKKGKQGEGSGLREELSVHRLRIKQMARWLSEIDECVPVTHHRGYWLC